MKKTQNGITLIALVITIIVMLILVGVTISMTIKGGLFDYAGKAVADMNNVMQAEKEFANEGITVGKKYYNSIEEYLGLTGENAGENEGPIKISLNISGTDVKQVPVPEGFTHVEGTTIDKGYVIRDTNGNEFVWVPVKQGQKIALKVESEEDIQDIILKDPMGAEIELGLTEGNNIGKTYNNTQIEPTYNGMYTVRVVTEEATEKETLTVRSLYAIDTWNDWYITNQGIEYLAARLNMTGMTKEQILTVVATQMMPYEGLEAAMAATGCADEDEFITYIIATMQYSQGVDSVSYNEQVKSNGGFFIGRYELGSTTEARLHGDENDTLTDIIGANGLPAIKAGCYPYSCITFQQALQLTESMYNSEEFTDSLITSAAWDRTLGWIYETSGNKAETFMQIVKNCEEWGNYSDAEFIITDGEYYEYSEETRPNQTYKRVLDIETKTYKKWMNSRVLLTTGVTTIPAKRNCKNNIFDLVGNTSTWINTANASSARGIRGGDFDRPGYEFPAIVTAFEEPSSYFLTNGARAALFLSAANNT